MQMAAATKALAVALLTQVAEAHFSCIHDSLLEEPRLRRSQVGEQAYAGGGRRLQATSYQPLRIQTSFVNIDQDPIMAANPSRVSFLRDVLVPATVRRWSSMLSTIPVQGSLYAYRECLASYNYTAPALCAAFDSSTGCANSGDDEVITFTSSMLGQQTQYSYRSGPATSVASYSTSVLPAGAGIAGADFLMFVTAKQTARCGSGGSGVLAYASTCGRDQFDRPTFGRINMCPGNLNEAADAWTGQYGVAMHEFAHALGFSSSSWALFRHSDADRTPRTPRNPVYPDQPLDEYIQRYTCAGQSGWVNYRPANNTVAYFSERGMQCAEPNFIPPFARATSDCVHKAVGAEVVKVARDFFACPTLNGVELENQLTSPCDVQGSHWEQRILSTELMSSYTQHAMLVSPLTLAMLADSGWYTANYSAADGWRAGLDWGFRQGCAFATEKCLSSAGVGIGNPPHFYSTSKGVGDGTGVCTTDRRAVGYVSIGDYSSNLPSQYQYYAGLPRRGGSTLETMDYCPAIAAYSNLRCWSTANGDQYTYKGDFGESFGATSACFESSLRSSSFATGRGAGCYQYACSRNDTVVITTRNTAGSTYSVTCGPGSAGRANSVPGFQGSLFCPDPVPLCSGVVLKLDPAVTPPPFPSASPTPGHVSRPTATPTPAPAQVALLLNFTFSGVTVSSLVNTTAGRALRDAFINDLAAAIVVPANALYIRMMRDRSSGLTVTYGWASGPTASTAVVLSTTTTAAAVGGGSAADAAAEAVDGPGPHAVPAPGTPGTMVGAGGGDGGGGGVMSAASAAPMPVIVTSGGGRRLQISSSSTDVIVAYRVAVAEPSPDPALGSTGTQVGSQQAADRASLALTRLQAAMGSGSGGTFTLDSPAFASTVTAQCAVAYPGQSLAASSPQCTSLAGASGSPLTNYAFVTVPPDAPGGGGSGGTTAGPAVPLLTILVAAVVGAVALCCIVSLCAYYCCLRNKREASVDGMTGKGGQQLPQPMQLAPVQPVAMQLHPGRPVGHGAVPYAYPPQQQTYAPQQPPSGYGGYGQPYAPYQPQQGQAGQQYSYYPQASAPAGYTGYGVTGGGQRAPYVPR